MTATQPQLKQRSASASTAARVERAGLLDGEAAQPLGERQLGHLDPAGRLQAGAAEVLADGADRRLGLGAVRRFARQGRALAHEVAC